MSANRRQLGDHTDTGEQATGLDEVWPALYALMTVVELIDPSRHVRICAAIMLPGFDDIGGLASGTAQAS